MKSMKWLLISGLILVLTGCAGMTEREKCIVGGAVIGGVTGSVLSDGRSAGTLGGAVVGGFIGNELGADYRCP
jgi:osmotically inducible lipoprotein OsmB